MIANGKEFQIMHLRLQEIGELIRLNAPDPRTGIGLMVEFTEIEEEGINGCLSVDFAEGISELIGDAVKKVGGDPKSFHFEYHPRSRVLQTVAV